MKRHATQLCRELNPIAQVPDMRAVAQCRQCNALCFGFCAGETGGVFRADLAKAQPAFKHGKARRFIDGAWFSAANNVAHPNLLDVLFDAQHAVRGVAGEIGFDEIVRNRFRFARDRTGGNEDGCRQVLECSR